MAVVKELFSPSSAEVSIVSCWNSSLETFQDATEILQGLPLFVFP